MSESVLIKPMDNLGGLSKEEVLRILCEKLQNRVLEAYIFGSFFTNSFSVFSDIDLILIQETNLSFIERGLEFSDLREWLPAIEPLIYTPSEFSRLTSEPTAGFWQTVVETMRKII